MNHRVRRRGVIGCLASAAVVVLAPIVVDLVIFVPYATRYHGLCEPHPTDIPARPCTYAQYLEDWIGDPFALMALTMIDVLVVVVAAAVVGAVWLVVRLGAGSRRRASR